MTHEEILKFYTATREAHPGQPKDGEFDNWKNVLSGFTRGQLDAALRRWHDDTEIEQWTDQPRGSRMPSATELKASINDFERLQESLAGGRFKACGRNGCEAGWVPIGELAENAKLDLRRRKSCACRIQYIRQKKGMAA